jgi:phage gpG-like protein
MPAVKTEAQTTDTVDRWGPAIQTGAQRGIQQAAGVVRDEAVASLERNADPWGAAFAPLSPTTLKLYATEGDPRGAISGSLRAQLDPDGKRGVVRPTGRARRFAGFKQYGSPNNRMFDNANPAPVPARPFLPIRDSGVVDLPPAVSERVLAAIREGLVRAIARGPR